METVPIDTSQLFDLCDREKKGYLTVSDLKAVCPQLDEDEIQFIFASLDSDGSGHIDRNEFLGGFQNALSQGENQGFDGLRRRASVVELPDDFRSKLNSENDVDGQEIPTSAKSTKLAHLETPHADVYDSESDGSVGINYNFSCQDDLLLLYEQLQISGMPQVLRRFEKVIGGLCKEIEEQKVENLRLQRVNESERSSYNRRMNEVESEVNLAISQTEKQAREEERERLTREKEEMRQRLESEVAELSANLNRMKHVESLLRNRMNNNEEASELKSRLEHLSDENQSLKTNLADSQLELALIKAELAAVRSDFETKKDELLSDNELILQCASQSENLQRQLQLLYDANRKLHDTNDSLREALEQRTSVCRQFNLRTPSPTGSFGGGTDFYSTEKRYTSCIRDSSTSYDGESENEVHVRRDGLNAYSEELCKVAENLNDSSSIYDEHFSPATGPPQRTFRVVMCGDASVGKSSIVSRIIKGSFVGNLPSTLGIDFQVKTAKLDNMNVAIQLWDTAGQERFRSLCKSYFRRADGVILVYDCTSERTFLNVREWIIFIKDSITRSIPILICGNKTDLRSPSIEKRSLPIVSKWDGSKLAKELGVMFIESSALDGSNIEESLVLLTRQMMASEDVEMNCASIELMDNKFIRSSSLCCGKK